MRYIGNLQQLPLSNEMNLRHDQLHTEEIVKHVRLILLMLRAHFDLA